MSKSNDAILQRAYELIEKDELEQAQEILAPLLEADASNASLWWVYTHAMRDRAIGQAALDRVLEIDPSYPGARELKADLQQIQAQEDEFAALRQGGNGSAPQKTAYDIDDWEDLQPAVDSQRSSRAIGRGAIVVVLALAIVVAGLGLVVSGAVELPAWLTDLFPSPEPAVIVVAAPTGEANLGLLEVNATSLPAEAGAQAEMTAPAPEDDEAPGTERRAGDGDSRIGDGGSDGGTGIHSGSDGRSHGGRHCRNSRQPNSSSRGAGFGGIHQPGGWQH